MNPEMNQTINPMENPEMKTLFAVLRVSRALKRCPPDLGERPFPPAVGRMMHCVQMNPGVSSRELCEMLDLRPSSLSEMLTRAEEDGLLIRTADESDKRVQHISLSEKGARVIAGIAEAQRADAAKKTACFTPEEKAQMAALCNKLSTHLEKLAIDAPMPGRGHGPDGRRNGPWPRHGGPGYPPMDPDHPGPEFAPMGPNHPGPEFSPMGPGHNGPGHPPIKPDHEKPEDSPESPDRRPKLPPDARIRC